MVDLCELYAHSCRTDGTDIVLEFLNALTDKQATECYLTNRTLQLRDEDIKCICDALASDIRLRSIFFDANRVSPLGVTHIYEMLLRNHTLTTISLASNQISDEGTKYVAEAMRRNSTVTKFDLSANRIGIGGCTALGEMLSVNTSLKHLVLNNNDIDCSCASAIALGVSGNPKSGLRHMFMAFNAIEDEGAGALACALARSQCTLESLDLSANRIGIAGGCAIARALDKCPSLRRLSIRSNAIRSDGLLAFADYVRRDGRLSELYIGYNHITENAVSVFLRSLLANTHIVSIGILGCHLNDDSASALAEVVANQPYIQKIFVDTSDSSPTQGVSVADLVNQSHEKRAARGLRTVEVMSMFMNEMQKVGTQFDPRAPAVQTSEAISAPHSSSNPRVSPPRTVPLEHTNRAPSEQTKGVPPVSSGSPGMGVDERNKYELEIKRLESKIADLLVQLNQQGRSASPVQTRTTQVFGHNNYFGNRPTYEATSPTSAISTSDISTTSPKLNLRQPSTGSTSLPSGLGEPSGRVSPRNVRAQSVLEREGGEMFKVDIYPQKVHGRNVSPYDVAKRVAGTEIEQQWYRGVVRAGAGYPEEPLRLGVPHPQRSHSATAYAQRPGYPYERAPTVGNGSMKPHPAQSQAGPHPSTQPPGQPSRGHDRHLEGPQPHGLKGQRHPDGSVSIPPSEFNIFRLVESYGVLPKNIDRFFSPPADRPQHPQKPVPPQGPQSAGQYLPVPSGTGTGNRSNQGQGGNPQPHLGVAAREAIHSQQQHSHLHPFVTRKGDSQTIVNAAAIRRSPNNRAAQPDIIELDGDGAGERPAEVGLQSHHPQRHRSASIPNAPKPPHLQTSVVTAHG